MNELQQHYRILYHYAYLQVAQLSQRDRVIGWVSYSQKWKAATGRHYFVDIIGISSTIVTQLASKAIEFGDKRKMRLLRRSGSFKIIEIGINRKPVCDFLLVINSNYHPISYRFGVMAA